MECNTILSQAAYAFNLNSTASFKTWKNRYSSQRHMNRNIDKTNHKIHKIKLTINEDDDYWTLLGISKIIEEKDGSHVPG